MKSQALMGFPHPYLMAVGLIIFFGFFTIMTFFVFSKSQKEKNEKMSNLPLHS